MLVERMANVVQVDMHIFFRTTILQNSDCIAPGIVLANNIKS